MRWIWALLLVVAGCAAPADSWPTGPADLVLRVVDTGGLIGRGAEFELPELSLYGDGLLVLPGKPVVHRRLTVDGLRRVMRSALNAGLAKEEEFGEPLILDAPVSIFTVVTTGKRVENTVVAPFELDGENAAQSEARRRVHAFRKGLNDLDSWLGDEIGPAVTPEPGPTVVFSYKADPPQGKASLRWPHGDLPDGGCGLLSPPQVRALPQPLPGQLWQQGDSFFYLVLRPLLPDERGCADIKWRH